MGHVTRLFAVLLSAAAAVGAAGAETTKPFGQQLADAAAGRLNQGVVYDGAYRRIAYPGGDVAPDRGVCTDLVIRAYRKLGVDLQVLVHQDMKRNFSAYPKNWGLRRPDTNIDHRRVPNLERFLTRAGAALPLSRRPMDFLPGDIVSYRLSNGLPHIAIVAEKRGRSGAPMIYHNIGGGPELEDTLFAYRMVGHFRYRPEAR